MSASNAHPDAAGRNRAARLFTFVLVAGALALILLLLAPDQDPATRAVARTRHITRSIHVRPSIAHVGHWRPATVPRTAHQSSPSLPVVTLAPQASATPVPLSFLGISTEYWSLPLFERHGSLLERALSLFETPGEGPLVLRIGGDSADHTFWQLKRRPPGWAVDLGPRWLSQTAGLVRELNARVILDLNLITDSPLAAADWAGVAAKALPSGSLAGFEVGNEPDLYARRNWSAAMRRPALALTFPPKNLSPAVYLSDFDAFSRTLAQVAPNVPLVGPAVANPVSDLSWISTLLASPHPRLGEVSGHVYPYSECSKPGRSTYPTIARVLSNNASTGIANRLRPAIALAHRAGLPFRLTEINSVTCGGKPGVSDTFATALWAPDALFSLVRAGVDGVNVHVRAEAVNAAFSLGRQGMVAHPLLYGLMLFDRALGPGAQLAATRLSLPRQSRPTPSPRLKVWAVRVNGGGLHVVLIDKGSGSVRVALHLPASGPATVERLLAPSVRARGDVTLAGQHIGADGRWQGPLRTETVWPGRDGYVVTVPRMSAALVGMRLTSTVFRASGDVVGPSRSPGQRAGERSAL